MKLIRTTCSFLVVIILLSNANKTQIKNLDTSITLNNEMPDLCVIQDKRSNECLCNVSEYNLIAKKYQAKTKFLSTSDVRERILHEILFSKCWSRFNDTSIHIDSVKEKNKKNEFITSYIANQIVNLATSRKSIESKYKIAQKESVVKLYISTDSLLVDSIFFQYKKNKIPNDSIDIIFNTINYNSLIRYGIETKRDSIGILYLKKLPYSSAIVVTTKDSLMYYTDYDDFRVAIGNELAESAFSSTNELIDMYNANYKQFWYEDTLFIRFGAKTSTQSLTLKEPDGINDTTKEILISSYDLPDKWRLMFIKKIYDLSYDSLQGKTITIHDKNITLRCQITGKGKRPPYRKIEQELLSLSFEKLYRLKLQKDAEQLSYSVRASLIWSEHIKRIPDPTEEEIQNYIQENNLDTATTNIEPQTNSISTVSQKSPEKNAEYQKKKIAEIVDLLKCEKAEAELNAWKKSLIINEILYK